MSDRCAHCGTAGVHHCYAAEVARLREALESASAACGTCSGTGVMHLGCPLCDVDNATHECQDFDDEPCPDEACKVARAALERTAK